MATWVSDGSDWPNITRMSSVIYNSYIHSKQEYHLNNYIVVEAG